MSVGPQTPRPHSTSASSVNVLVVDDTSANREAFEALLRPLGYAVFLAGSGHEALQLASRFHFGVILLDVRMPVLNGIETAGLLRRKPFTRSTPIIFVSAFEETEVEVSRSDLDRVVDFVYSPVNMEVLTWKVRTWADLYIKHELLRREVARLSEVQEALRQLASRPAVPVEELREVESRLSISLRRLIESLSERLGITA